MTPYPLFDTGFTIWTDELESMIADRLGVALKSLGLGDRQLMARYHEGVSSTRMAEAIVAGIIS